MKFMSLVKANPDSANMRAVRLGMPWSLRSQWRPRRKADRDWLPRSVMRLTPSKPDLMVGRWRVYKPVLPQIDFANEIAVLKRASRIEIRKAINDQQAVDEVDIEPLFIKILDEGITTRQLRKL